MLHYFKNKKFISFLGIFCLGFQLPVHAQNYLASSSSTGFPGNNHSAAPTVSDDGRYLAFSSISINLVANDTNSAEDVFLKDTSTGATTIVSVSSTGTQGNSFSSDPKIAPDGSFVIFVSGASNLVANDTNGTWDVFKKDISTGAISIVSVSSTGVQANGLSDQPRISRNGRYVLFTSEGTNLFANDTNGKKDVFIRDLQRNITVHVSRTSTGGLPNNDCRGAGITSDARYVVFDSTATNLVPGDTNGKEDVFVRDIVKGTTKIVSASATGVFGNQNSKVFGKHTISEDGKYVAFTTDSNNLVPNDTNGGQDIFVKNMRDNSIFLATLNTAGAQTTQESGFMDASISSDGRFVMFTSHATNLDTLDTNNGFSDVFVRDTNLQTTNLLSIATTGFSGNSDSRDTYMSLDTRHFGFYSFATNMVSPTTALGIRHVYRKTRSSQAFGYSNSLYGGCGGVGDKPFLFSTSPILGRTVTIQGEHVGANKTGFILLGLHAQPGFPLGNGCVLHLSPLAYLNLGAVQSDNQGKWSFSFGIPNIPSLSGQKLVVQAIFPGSGVFGLDLTDAALWTIGN